MTSVYYFKRWSRGHAAIGQVADFVVSCMTSWVYCMRIFD